MRIRITKSEPLDKIAWWRRGGDEVEAAYEELFPNSRLPLFRRFGFWLAAAGGGVLLFADPVEITLTRKRYRTY